MMKSTVLLGFASLAIWSVGSSSRAEDKPAAPKIQFSEETFDFQTVKSGEVVKHSFVFTNTGSATLNIENVKPGCGCTTAGTWDTKVEPGKTGSIPLQFNSTSFGGKVTKMATVTCNDPGHSNVVLQLTGTVWRPLDFTPSSMAMFTVMPDEQTAETKTIHIVSNVDEPVTLSTPELNSPSFKAELLTVKPGKEFDLKVTSVPPFTNAYASAPIKIKSSIKEMPELNLTAYATVMPAVQVMPQQLIIPGGPVAANTRQIVSVHANGSRRVHVSDATSNIPGAMVSVTEPQPGKVIYLTLNLPAGFQIPPGQSFEITAKTDNPQFAQLRIPVTQAAQQPTFGQPPTIKIPVASRTNSTTTAH